MKLILIRHTSVDVPKGMCYGQSEVELGSDFKKEAKEVQRQLSKYTFDVLYSSPLSRGLQLAEALGCGMDIVQDNRLKEMHFGDWEQQLWSDIYQNHESKNWFDDYISVRCPNGESFVDVIDRVNGFLVDLKSNLSCGTVAIITHAGVIRAFLSILKNIEPRHTFDYKIGYGEIFHLEYN